MACGRGCERHGAGGQGCFDYLADVVEATLARLCVGDVASSDPDVVRCMDGSWVVEVQTYSLRYYEG